MRNAVISDYYKIYISIAVNTFIEYQVHWHPIPVIKYVSKYRTSLVFVVMTNTNTNGISFVAVYPSTIVRCELVWERILGVAADGWWESINTMGSMLCNFVILGMPSTLFWSTQPGTRLLIVDVLLFVGPSSVGFTLKHAKNKRNQLRVLKLDKA